MANINFVLPINADDLLTPCPDQYSVAEVLSIAQVSKALKVAATAYRDLGPTYILQTFDTYFSATQHYTELPKVVLYGAFEDIQKSLRALPNALAYYLEDSDSLTEEVMNEVQNTLKMSIYLYTTLFTCLEKAFTSDSIIDRAKKKAKGSEGTLNVDWTTTISVIRFLFQLDLSKFWDNSGMDSTLVNKLLELAMMMLEDTQIKNDKNTQSELWSFFGLLVTKYQVTNALVIRLARLVKEVEFLVPILADCVKNIVEECEAKELLVLFVIELTEWQLQEANVESNATRNCARLVVEIAVRLPEHMQGMLEYLSKFLRVDSHQLRAMVLGVQVEVLDAGSAKVDGLPPAEKEQWRLLRNEILTALEQFTHDSSPFVRARVYGHITRLLQESIVHPTMLLSYLQKAVLHLKDGAAPVRKAAANCVTAMLKHNTFGHQLPYKKLLKDYTGKRNALLELKYEIHGIDMQKQEEIEREWNEHLPALKETLAQQEMEVDDGETSDGDKGGRSRSTNSAVEDDEDDEDGPIQDAHVTSTEPQLETAEGVDEMVRLAIAAKDYKAAMKHCRTAEKASTVLLALRERIDAFTDTQFFLCYMHIVFSNVAMNPLVQPTKEQLAAISEQETNVAYLAELITFLESMSVAMGTMCDLLNSVNIGDMHEAVDFIITANQFKLDDAPVGINALLKIMLRNEEDRRKVAGGALKTIYLTTDATHLLAHTSKVSDNLISLYRSVSAASVDALTTLVALWANEGTLSNDIIDALWNYFLLKHTATPQDSRTALCILRLATYGRHSIIERNYRIVARVCFGERGLADPLLVVEGMDMLCMLSNAGVSITSKHPAFRIDEGDQIWKQMMDIIKSYQTNSCPVVNNVLASAVRLIFALHTHPFKCIEALLVMFAPPSTIECEEDDVIEYSVLNVPTYALVRYNVLVGEIAMGMLIYLDTDVYKELKRRQTVKNDKKGKQHQKHKNGVSKINGVIQCTPANTSALRSVKGSANANRSGGVHEWTPVNSSALRTVRAANISGASSALNASMQSNAESVLDETVVGAEAMDEDADFIAHVLEHSIDFKSFLWRMFHSVLEICRRPTFYTSEIVQVSAATAMARGMLLSTLFCQKHALLMFTILIRSRFVQVKVALLVHLVDLMDRCPNIIEPYTPKLYDLLEDANLEVREVALNTLSLLILKDMVRPQGDIWRLAVCLVDDEPTISKTARSFFLQSTDKSNNLYNYMPDIFTSLAQKYRRLQSTDEDGDKSSSEELSVPPIDSNEEKFQTILQYLFTLIDKPKQIEVLVERFCLKFDNADDELAKRIAFALSLLPYNERALQKLIDNFPRFKHFVLVDEVYSWMKVIFNGAKGKEVKPLVAQLEDFVKEMFKVDGRPPRNIFKKPAPPKRQQSAKKAKNGRKTPTRGKRQMVARSDSDSESDEDYGSRNVKKGTRRVSRTRRQLTEVA